MFDLKLGQIKTELKQELIGTVAVKINEVKDDLTGKIEAMKAPLKTELVKTVEAILVPDFDQKLDAKVIKLKEDMVDPLKQDLVSTV